MAKRNVELERAMVLDADLPALVRMARKHDPNFRIQRIVNLVLSALATLSFMVGIINDAGSDGRKAAIVAGVILCGLGAIMFFGPLSDLKWPTNASDKNLIRRYLGEIFLTPEQRNIIENGPQRAAELRDSADRLEAQVKQIQETEAQDGRCRTQRLADNILRKAERMRREADAIESARSRFFQTPLGHLIVSAETAVLADIMRREVGEMPNDDLPALESVTAADCAESIEAAFAGVRLDAATMAPEYDAADPALDEAIEDLTAEAYATQPRSRITPPDITDAEFENEPDAATAAHA